MPDHNPGGDSTASNNLDDLDNPLVTSNFTNVRSDQLDISALTSAFTGKIAPHNRQGQFRTRCQYSHFAYDDPIIFPNQPGAAHLHMFFGNTEADAYSTGQSLLNSGGGSCQGGELNRSAYWMPALFDANDDVRIPFDFVAYYKTNRPDLVEEMPTGLAMVTNSAAVTPKVKWSCARNRDVNLEYGTGNTIPNCNNGDLVKASIGFPECWDGRLDSADHKSHLAYMKQDTCPASHPRVIPTVTYNVYFEHDGNTSNWYLSSDRTHGNHQANGSTLHADWLGAWNEEIMAEWTTNCTQAQMTCHVGPISATRKLSSFSNDDRYHGPNKISDNRLQPSLH